MKKVLFISIILLQTCFGQDIHFSQFFNSPLQINPALAGQIDKKARFAANQRVQYRSISGNPYNTFAISGDVFEPYQKEKYGAGASIMHDITGDSKFRTLQINLAGSYIIPIDSNQSLSIGIQPGFTHRTIDYSALSFDSQYNGFQYDPNLNNNENFQKDARNYFNLNLGLNYKINIKERAWGSAGFALYNITKPKQTFFADDNIKLDRRASINLEGQYPINLKWDLQPKMFMMFQGKYKEIIIGTLGKYTIINERGVYRAAYAGTLYRNGDAGYIFAGFDYNDWHLGLSYDINLSNLKPASLRRGGWEIALIYKINPFIYKSEQHRVCPDYMF